MTAAATTLRDRVLDALERSDRPHRANELKEYRVRGGARFRAAEVREVLDDLVAEGRVERLAETGHSPWVTHTVYRLTAGGAP